MNILKKILQNGLPVPLPLRWMIRSLYRGGVWLVEGLTLIRSVLFIVPVLRSICDRAGYGLRADRIPYMRGRGRLQLGNRVNLSGRSCFYFMSGMPEPPVIEIGDSVFIGNKCTLSAARRVRIGAGTLIGPGVRIHDNDGHPLDPGRRARKERITADEAAPVTIGTNVWIGAGAVVLKGVNIGDDSVVGAGSVVTANVPPQTIVAGNPARRLQTAD